MGGGPLSGFFQRPDLAFVASACVRIVVAGACIPVPAALDRPAARVVLLAVRLYRRFLSNHVGRHCLFRVSCSEYALSVISSYGCAEGLRLAAVRLHQCGGAYSLASDALGRVTLVAEDGTQFHDELLATWLAASRSPTSLH
jgi:putative component of membrane protein insertase Oxa1/YidC/SpoIIIJ protein YidD